MNRPKRRFGLPVSNVKESRLLLRCGMDRETLKVRRREKWPARDQIRSQGLVTLLNEGRKKAACRKSSSDRRAPGIHRRGAEAAVRRR